MAANKFKVLLIGLVAAGLLVTTLVVEQLVTASVSTSGEGDTHKVRAGGGGPKAPLTLYFPRSLEISVGDSVTWYNPTKVAEPHTVTFVFDNSYRTNLETPFLVSEDSSITSIPNTNSEPIMLEENGQKVLIGLNARAFNPVVIGSDGNVSYLPLNSSYIVKGDEKYINSGFLWPEDIVLEGLPPNASFTLTFEKSGVYSYYCIIHPWQVGSITVK
ncbi:MAG: hypothetical protein QW574_00065 [Candidatus Nitrosocaldus sp.]